MLLYFDTSAINYVKGQWTIGDAIATRDFQHARGRRWAISPVAIWEILNTSNEEMREELIFFSQHLFSEMLLPSPEEILVTYIKQGCPRFEQIRELTSNSPLAVTWLDICRDSRKTLIFKHDELRSRFGMVAAVTRDLHRLTRNRAVSLEKYDSDVVWDISLERVVNQLSWVKRGEVPTDFERRLYKISAFYILFLLCAGIGVDPEPVKRFWREIGISQTLDRFKYLLAHYEVLIHCGPIVVMAYMTIVQAEKKFSRGMYWDSLHSLYLTYVDCLLSEDQHFFELRTVLPPSFNTSKIQRPSELEWEFHDR